LKKFLSKKVAHIPFMHMESHRTPYLLKNNSYKFLAAAAASIDINPPLMVQMCNGTTAGLGYLEAPLGG
jgi:hypothetical protein